VVGFKGREPHDIGSEMLQALRQVDAAAILLAGFLRMIPASVVAEFPRRILNIHPALLPSFGGEGMYGRHVHEAVLRVGASVSGATVHFVDTQYDTGPIIAQWPVPVHRGDTAELLAGRVLAVEHRLYPAVAHHLAMAIQSGRNIPRFAAPLDAFVGGAWDAAGFADALNRGFREN